MGAILLLFTGFILLAYSLARPPRRIEGALLACMLAGMGLFAYVTWQAKTSEPDPKDVNINTATVAELARATDIPADIAESVVRVRQFHVTFVPNELIRALISRLTRQRASVSRQLYV